MTSRPTRRCSIRVACTRSSSGTSPATPRRWWSGSAACRPSSSSRWRGRGRRTRAGSAQRRWCTASAGRSTPFGAQYIRAGAIIQLLLGNMGRPGGGVIALRGHASIQGSTDIPTLFNLLPGYLPMPQAATRRWTTTSTASPATSRKASGATPVHTWCPCSRSTGATRRPPRTTTASTTYRGSAATTAPIAR